MTNRDFSRCQRRLFTLLLAGLLYAAIEATSWIGLWLLARFRGLEYAPVATALLPKHEESLRRFLAGETGLFVFDRTLGWKPRPASGGRYTINSQGIRARYEVADEPEAGKLRITTFGDSFTFGADVEDEATFQEQLTRLDPGLEVVNLAVPGYGLGQACLRYREEGKRLGSQVVLIGFLSENLRRVVNVYRPFYFHKTRLPLTKPRFALEEGELVLVENPMRELEGYRALLEEPEATLKRLGRRDFFYGSRLRPGPFDVLPSVRLAKLLRQHLAPAERIVEKRFYNPQSEAFRVTVRLFESFYREVEDDGAAPVVVVFPDRRDLGRFRKDGTRQYRPLLEALEARGLRHVDAMDAFAELAPERSVKELVRIHYTRAGNRYVAEHILHELREWELVR